MMTEGRVCIVAKTRVGVWTKREGKEGFVCGREYVAV